MPQAANCAIVAATRTQESEPLESSWTMASERSTQTMPVITKNSQTAANTVRARMLTPPPSLPSANIALPRRAPSSLPSGASAQSATGIMTNMVSTGTKTTASMSGTTFFASFSTWASTGMHRSMGRTVVE